MNYNFTDRVRQALATAREEAIRLQHDYVGTEHMLLGLIREGEGVAVAVLQNLRASPGEIRKQVEASVRRGKAVIALGELPYTSRAKKVLEFSMTEARELNHNYVGTEHLLLALLREEKGIAAEVLNRVGVTLDEARREVRRLLESGVSESRASRPERFARKLADWAGKRPEPRVAPGFSVTIDDESSSSIYEQIVAQVREAIATRRLQPGERLPTVRQMADELDIAPGTVARAYSELERLGVVVTEGSRGTRVAEQPQDPLGSEERPETLVGLLRPVVVAAFHLGATAKELRNGLETAMQGIFPNNGA